jgi:predicted ATPase with chaperone activity
MVGSPGSGKTLLARAIPGILPAMSIDESLDVTRISSVADALPPGTPLIRNRPFRAPHHTISHAGLVGGGNWRAPYENHIGQAIADLAGSETIQTPHLMEALQYRPKVMLG